MADYATLLRDHVTLTCRCVDRIFLQAYVPKLQTVGWVCQFLNRQRGFVIPSLAAFGKIGAVYVAEVHRWAEANDVPVIYFKKGENRSSTSRRARTRSRSPGRCSRPPKVQVARGGWCWLASGRRRHRCGGRGRPKVKSTGGTRTWSGAGRWPSSITSTSTCGTRSGVARFGRPTPTPYSIWIWLNGHEWAQRQCVKAGIGFTALDNGFRSCEDPAALQRICDRLGSGAVHRFFWRWCRRLPSPFTDADRRAGYNYQLAFRQVEVSDTRVFDRPAAGRAFFEGLIRDHLDIGRPDSVALIFARRISIKTPGAFRTRVITDGVDPQISCYYRASRIKQYFKDHRALRTETVICDTHDFGIGRRVKRDNWQALRAVGDQANQRLCDAQASDARPAPDVATFAAIVAASTTTDGQHAPGLRFGDTRVMAVLAAIVAFVHLIAGFDNRALATRVAALLDRPYGSRQATYDLRRLRRKQLIVRLPGHHRY
jgi:hypothetical protein